MRSWYIALLGLLLWTSAMSAQAYRLVYKDHAGDVRTYRAVETISGTLTMMGESGQIKENISLPSITEKVIAARDDEADLSLSYRNNKRNVIFTDNATKTSKTLKSPIPDTTMLYTRSTLGMVTDYHKEGTGAKNDIFSQLDAVTGLQDTQSIIFPERDLNIGDSWDGTQEIAFGDENRVTVDTKYKLMGTKVVNGKTLLVITGVSSVDIPLINITVPQIAPTAQTENTHQLPPMQMSLQLHTKSTMLFDEEAGNYRESTVSASFKISIFVEGMDRLTTTMAANLTGRFVRTN